MNTRTVNNGDMIASREQTVDRVWYIADGMVKMSAGNIEISLKKGDFIGLADLDTGIHSFDYTAVNDVSLLDFSTIDNLYRNNFFISKPENSRAVAFSLNRIIRETYLQLNTKCTRSSHIMKMFDDMYAMYIELAKKAYLTPERTGGMADMPEPVDLTYIQKTLYQLHKSVGTELTSKENSSKLISEGVIPGYMFHAAGDLHEIMHAEEYISCVCGDCESLIMNEDEDDLCALFEKLYAGCSGDKDICDKIVDCLNKLYSLAEESVPDMAGKRRKRMEASISGNEAVMADDGGDGSVSVADVLAGSMEKIFKFADYPENKADIMRSAIEDYKGLSDPYSTDDGAKKVRKVIEENFYQLYLAVLEKYLETEEIPVIIKMFLNFGYLDEELAGMDNAYELYNISQNYEGKPENGIFLGYEWLLAIYTRNREPGINEFDQTFEQYVKEQVDNGRIPVSDMKLYLSNRGQMVMFELQNMFRRASRMCSGQILTFCPVFSAHQTVRNPLEDLTTPDAVISQTDAFRNIDFSLFYRETVCVFDKKENIHDQIHVEVLPDVIILPVVGSRGTMWQEIAGRNRLSPARMLFPAINIEKLDKIMLRVLAEYRWEMCKRMQGARWNDVTDPSLTSLYCDYLQFYRKNSEINPDQREKIRLMLQKCKNNYKECFISDYADYIRYESNGAPHLTKSARAILFASCPFSATIRMKLGENPIYAELGEKYRLKCAQQTHRLVNIQKKLVSKGRPVPKELEREISFVEF